MTTMGWSTASFCLISMYKLLPRGGDRRRRACVNHVRINRPVYAYPASRGEEEEEEEEMGLGGQQQRGPPGHYSKELIANWGTLCIPGTPSAISASELRPLKGEGHTECVLKFFLSSRRSKRKEIKAYTRIATHTRRH